MAKLRVRKEKKGAVKKELKEVELHVEELMCELSLQDITKIEVNEMLRRIGMMAKRHNLEPIIENIKIKFVPIGG